MRTWFPLLAVAAAFVALCLAFAEATPYRKPGVLLNQRDANRQPIAVPDVGAPDERQHANYVATLLRGEGFPVLKPGDPNLYETYQAHQPPLYYIVAAGWCRALGLDPTLPADGVRLRWLNTLIGFATLAALFCGGLWATGRPEVGAAAAAFGLMPMSIALNSAVSNDPLLFALMTWVAALTLKGVQQGWTTALGLGVGVLTGLALVTKTTALALLPLVVVAVVLRPAKGKRLDVRGMAAALALPLLIAAPWWWRNVGLYGDPFALKAFNAAFVGSPQASTFIDGLGANVYWGNMVAWWTGRSLVGVFGYMDVFLFDSLRRDQAAALYSALLVVLGALAVVGLVNWCLPGDARGEAKGEPAWRPALLSAVLLGVVLLLFVRFNAQYFQGQARYLYPAVGPMAWLVGAGACRAAGRAREWAWLGLGAGLALLSWYALGVVQAGFAARTGP